MDAPKSPSTRLASLSIETSDVEQDIKDTDALVWEAAPRQRLDSGVVLSPSTTFPAHLFPKSTEDAIPALSTPLIVFVDTDLPTDPALAFPPELFLHVLAFLGSPAALAPCCLVSKTWKKAAEDSLIWSELVKWLWECKAYVPARFKELLAQGKAKDAYKLSLHDSKRDVITKDELCSFDWEWRFKADAGNHFTDEDPWWNNEKPRIRQFHPSGKMGGSFARPDITWRFVNNAEGKKGKHGRFVRVGPYPASVLFRHSNWGWFMQSAWTVATAFPMPPKDADPELEDQNLTVTTDTQRYEVLCYNSGLYYPDDLIMNRRGFERLVGRVGLLRRWWDAIDDNEDDDAEEGQAAGHVHVHVEGGEEEGEETESQESEEESEDDEGSDDVAREPEPSQADADEEDDGDMEDGLYVFDWR